MKLLVLSCVFFAHFAASSKVSESGVRNYDLDSWDTDLRKFDSETSVGNTEAAAKCCKCCDGTITHSADGSCSTCTDQIRASFSYSLAVAAPTAEAKATACEEAFATPPTTDASYTATGLCPIEPGKPVEGACPVRRDTAKAGDQLPTEVIYIRHGNKDADSAPGKGKFSDESKNGKNWRKPLTEKGEDNDPKVVMQFLYKYITSKTEETTWNDVVIYSSPWRRTISTGACLMQKLAEAKNAEGKDEQLSSGKLLKDIKLKLEKGFPEKDHDEELPYRGKYPCRLGCKAALDAFGEEGPPCDEPIVRIVKDHCGVKWGDDFKNGLSWFDETYKNAKTDELFKGPGSGIELDDRIELAWDTTINAKKYQPKTLVIIFGHGTFGQKLFKKHVEQKSWRNQNWWPGTMNFLRWNADNSKLKAVGEKYPFQDSFDLGRLGRCKVASPVDIKYYRRKQKTGTLMNWKGENGVPTALTVKLNKKNGEKCQIDYFQCTPSGKSAYSCVMAGYRGEFSDCANRGGDFANTFQTRLWPSWLKWNDRDGSYALASGLSHVTISGIGPEITALPSCADETATSQSLVEHDSKVSINAQVSEPGTGSLPQSLEDSEAKVSISEPVSEGLFLSNIRPILLLTAIAITVFWISLRNYRKKAAISTEAITYLLEDEL